MQTQTMTQQQWVALFRDIGLDDETMYRWHAAFEEQYPQAHQAFLEWLNIAPDTIRSIRALET